jgi:hypothetical protein
LYSVVSEQRFVLAEDRVRPYLQYSLALTAQRKTDFNPEAEFFIDSSWRTTCRDDTERVSDVEASAVHERDLSGCEGWKA